MNFKKLKKLLRKTLYRGFSEYDITPSEARKLMKESNVVFLDVRSPEEFREGHISGAISIPEYEIGPDILNILPNLDQNIIVYCESGSRSIKAVKALAKLGYTHLHNLEGGIENW